jgi:hypothetical protein
MLDFIKQYDSELIVFLGIGIAKVIILTTFAINGTLTYWVNGLLAPWF